MRVMTAGLVLLALGMLAVALPAAALFDVGFMGRPVNTGIPFVVGPCFTAAAPFSQGSVTTVMANTSTLAHDFAGGLAIAFPALESPGMASGPGFSPTIAQTTSETIAASRSYFFADFLQG